MIGGTAGAAAKRRILIIASQINSSGFPRIFPRVLGNSQNSSARPLPSIRKPPCLHSSLFIHPGASGSHSKPHVSTTAAATSSDSDAAPSPSSLQQPSFAVHRITGDGSCMFRALVQGAHLAQQSDAACAAQELLTPATEAAAAAALRSAVCAELLARRDDFAPFIDYDQYDSFDDYVSIMERGGVWGGEVELAAAAHVVKRPIEVYSVGFMGRGLSLVSTYEAAEEFKERNRLLSPATVLFHPAGHYDLLIRVV